MTSVCALDYIRQLPIKDCIHDIEPVKLGKSVTESLSCVGCSKMLPVIVVNISSPVIFVLVAQKSHFDSLQTLICDIEE